MSDPTLHLLQSLDDPERYVCVRGVPVFVPHVRFGDPEEEGGEPEIEAQVDEEELALIAETLNRKVAEFGTPARISTGHVRLPKPDQPAPAEKDQPEILGWAKSARVGTWGPENKPGLLVDWYIRRERYEESLTYPYRSAEYYPPTHEITGIALLRRDPELDMGVLTYARREQPDTVMPEEFDDEDLDESPDNSDLEDDGSGEDEYSPEEHEQYARAMRYFHQHAQSRLDSMDPSDEDYPHMEQMARCYGRLAYEGEPSGGNTFIPGTDDEDLDEPPLEPVGGEIEEEDEPEQHARGVVPSGKRTQQYNRQRQPERKPRRRGAPAQYGRVYELEQQVAALKEQNQRRGEMVQYERELVRLQTQEGVELDIDQELADAEEMTSAARAKHLARIQKQYARSITGGSFLPTSGPSETRGAQGKMTARQRQAALDYAQRNNVGWPQAMAWAMQNA